MVSTAGIAVSALPEHRFPNPGLCGNKARNIQCLNMSDYDKTLDVANFVRIYKQNTGLLIADLQEVVLNQVGCIKLTRTLIFYST